MTGARPCYLGGELSTHARGQTLTASFGAVASDHPPKSGVLFVLGKELQRAEDRARGWVEWALTPGRVLVAAPPFGPETSDIPVRWEVRRSDPLAGGETALGKLLVRERRHEIRGQLLPLERTAGQVVTAGWRKHPASGLVVITALPVWSLTALDHRAACDAWLTGLLEQAGTPADSALDEDSPTITTSKRVPTQDEWTMLLHLCAGPYGDDDAVIDDMSRSSVHHLPMARASEALRGLVSLGLSEAGALTAVGERALLHGPYSAFARALRRRA